MAAVSVKRSIRREILLSWFESRRLFILVGMFQTEVRVPFLICAMVNTIPGRNLPVLNLLTRFAKT